MGIKKKDWMHLISTRSDMSSYVTHLTRATEKDSALDILKKIIKDRKLIGSTNKGYIQGNNRAVCFQDAPIPGIVQNVYQNQVQVEENKANKYRYHGIGLMIRKQYAFKKGARPVIYETKEEGRKRDPEELWRVVTFDLNNDNDFIDWTYEREWRIKGDFEFDLEEVVLLVPNKGAYQELVKWLGQDDLSKFRGIIQMGPINF